MPDKLVRHLYAKHGFTWCGRLWRDVYRVQERVCKTCVNRKENWEKLMQGEQEDWQPHDECKVCGAHKVNCECPDRKNNDAE